MCTALCFRAKDSYFGRNLDLDCSYGEEVCIMPRNRPLTLRRMGTLSSHYAMIGMATVVNGEPLFYDGANEYGLAMAGLNFPNNACYFSVQDGKDNVAPFEFIPWILGQARSIPEAKSLLARINLADIPFSESLPLSPLHWILYDGSECITVECVKDGLHVYENSVGVLTNNPPFLAQIENLKRYEGLRPDNAGISVPPECFCQGLGAVGLPGDVSSMSRFVRAVFYKNNSVFDGAEKSAVSQFFHLLDSVAMVRGGCRVGEGKYDITVYSSCINLARGLYYYTTYDNRQINCVDLHKTHLNGTQIIRFPLK